MSETTITAVTSDKTNEFSALDVERWALSVGRLLLTQVQPL
jgi:hypothetical protein